MTICAGTRLGSYEILSSLGAGGMGEVYKARDSRLDRFVAIKVIPESLAADKDLLARFEREAKAVAALSHPNVMGIHDFGKENGVTYAVMELLEGESLRQKLKGGPLPPKRAVEIAVELATGLGAAHAHGIVHRDVKPENIFVTADGHVKVLDFGLAKQVAASRAAQSELTTSGPGEGVAPTEKGVVLGTVGYMSPEQVRGEAADHRADVFGFGVVLYEMLSGRRPFGGDTAVQTMSAILEKEPPELTSPKGVLPPALDRIVAHCMEKRVEARFQSMADIAFALQNLSTITITSTPPGKVSARRRLWPYALGAAATAASVLLVVLLLGRAGLLHVGKAVAAPTFVRITHQSGTIESARFGPDGKTVYFSQRINGARPEIFVLLPGNREPKPLGIPDALLAAVSASNDLAILRSPRGWFSGSYLGTLSQVKGGEGALKEVQERVAEAAWDGQAFATISSDEIGSRYRLEFAGKVLVDAEGVTRILRRLCISRDGSRIALVDTGETGETGIVSYDRSGTRQVLYSTPEDGLGMAISGLAFGPEGGLWFSQIQEDQTAVWSVAPGGKPKDRWRGPGVLQLMDVSVAGRLLLAQQRGRTGILVQRPGGQPFDLGVQDGSQAQAMSGDGQTVLVLESPVMDGGVAADRLYLRKLDGSPALFLARGMARTLSRDSRWVQLDIGALPAAERDPAILDAYRQAGLDPMKVLDPAAEPVPHLLFVPTGPGRPRVVSLPDSLVSADWANQLPDGEHILFTGREKGHQFRWFLTDRAGKKVRPVSPEGYGMSAWGGQNISRDGKRIWVYNGKSYLVQELSGGDPIPVKGLEPMERVIVWASDDRSLLIRTVSDTLPVVISRFDPIAGTRQRLLSLDLPDKVGFLLIRAVLATPDAGAVVYTYQKVLSELFVVEGAAN